MKAKIAATVILIYAVILFGESVRGALLNGNHSIYTVPVTALLFVGPAIGIYRRINWCRIFLGAWAALVFVIFVSFSFRTDFHFLPSYVGYLLGTALPVFLLFFYPPLKRYTQKVQTRQSSGS